MRIIAGRAKGRGLVVPKSGTRPMTGRARESIFSILSSHVRDARVLDLYAGSGSLGLEALSRGAAEATFVERDRAAIGAIEGNIAAVGLGGSVVRGSVPEAIVGLLGRYDIVFVDPPYGDSDASVESTLVSLDQVLSADGLVVVHRQASSGAIGVEFLTSIDERRYGDAVVTMMKRATS